MALLYSRTYELGILPWYEILKKNKVKRYTWSELNCPCFLFLIRCLLVWLDYHDNYFYIISNQFYTLNGLQIGQLLILPSTRLYLDVKIAMNSWYISAIVSPRRSLRLRCDTVYSGGKLLCGTQVAQRYPWVDQNIVEFDEIDPRWLCHRIGKIVYQ